MQIIGGIVGAIAIALTTYLAPVAQWEEQREGAERPAEVTVVTDPEVVAAPDANRFGDEEDDEE